MQCFNQELGKDAARIFKTKGESISVADNIQPTREVQPVSRIISTTALNSAQPALSIPLLTTKGATYITGAYVAYQADVLATATAVRIRFTPYEQVEQILIALPKLTTTIGTATLSCTFNPPILMAKVAPYVDVTGGIAVGNIIVAGGLSYYQED